MEDVFRSVLNATLCHADNCTCNGPTGLMTAKSKKPANITLLYGYAIRPALDGRCVVVNATPMWLEIQNTYTSRLFAPFMVDGLGNKGLVLLAMAFRHCRTRAAVTRRRSPLRP